MFCENCGKEIPEDALFCPECGKKNIKTEAPPYAHQAEEMTQSYDIEPEVDYTDEEEKEISDTSDSKKLNVILVVLAAAFLITGVTVAVLMINGKGDKNNYAAGETDPGSQSELNLAAGESKESAESEEESESNTVEEPQTDEPKQEKRVISMEEEEEETQPELEESETMEEAETGLTPEKILETHTYQVVKKSLDWEKAEAYCEAEGGYLATITSEEEFNHIIGLLDKEDLKVCWLGGIDYFQNGEFSWITGEDFDYTKWAAGEPNNDGGIEHYLILYKVNGEWVWNDGPLDANTYYSDSAVGFICEWDD